jgi:hypothetical protein
MNKEMKRHLERIVEMYLKEEIRHFEENNCDLEEATKEQLENHILSSLLYIKEKVK